MLLAHEESHVTFVIVVIFSNDWNLNFTSAASRKGMNLEPVFHLFLFFIQGLLTKCIFLQYRAFSLGGPFRLEAMPQLGPNQRV
jgi:hypothetical protein